MGVRYLKTFLTKKVENGTFTVDVYNEIEKFKERFPNTTPVLIIDLHMLHRKLYNSNHEKLLGGRYNVFNERLHFILSKLKSLNARIIFYTDGPTKSEKIETNLRRRNDEYYCQVKIFQAIDNGLDKESSAIVRPTGMPLKRALPRDQQGVKNVSMKKKLQLMARKDIAKKVGKMGLTR